MATKKPARKHDAGVLLLEIENAQLRKKLDQSQLVTDLLLLWLMLLLVLPMVTRWVRGGAADD